MFVMMLSKELSKSEFQNGRKNLSLSPFLKLSTVHSKKNIDTDQKKNTEVSVFQYIFEIRSVSISI